jgi:SAM-dependent methyltransferase
MSELLFTGERLHEGNKLFNVDLMRHRAAYACAIEYAKNGSGQRILDLGCGTGYGTVLLAEASLDVFAIDRISPDLDARHHDVRYVRADAAAIPVSADAFDVVVSFQVIEHLEDPTAYLKAIAHMTRPGGIALLTTPNIVQSDKENPFHVHEYEADELKRLLEGYFDDVDMQGVTASAEPMAYFDERLRRIRRIVRIDPFGLRRRLPRKLIDWLFGRFAVIVRRGIQESDGLPDVTLADFPIVPINDRCLDLLAICRRPKDRPVA